MKKIWFVSHYSMPLEYEMRIKTQKYAKILNKRGYETKIFSASTLHNLNINLITGKEKYIEKTYDDLSFVHIKCHNYKGNGIKRILNMLEFPRKFRKIATHYEKPDAIVADVNCTNYYNIYKYCKKHNVKFYIDMRDLWPMSIVEYAGYSEKNPIIKYLYYREKIMYKRCDGVIFSMEGGKDYISDKKWEKYLPIHKIHYINNGVDIKEFDNNIKENTYDDVDLIDDTFKVIYAGSVREANNIGALYETARLMKEKSINDIKILVYGDGPDKEKFEKMCKNNCINNLIFKGQVEKKYIPYILSKGNVSILNYKKANTLKYGGSQNKLFEYMAAKKPVIITVSMNYNAVEQYNCGISIESPNSEDILNAITSIKELSEKDYRAMCERAYECAKTYDFEILTDKLENIIRGK